MIRPGATCELCKGLADLQDTRLNNPPCRPCLGGGVSRIKPGELCETCGGWGRLPNQPASEAPKVILVRAGKVWDSHMEMASLFRELQGELCICDPYYGTGSLLRLSGLDHCKPIRFLTQRADDKEQSFIGRALKEFTAERSHVEFRRCASKDLHDRYLLAPAELVILGHGLKDIGGKDSFVIRLDTDTCEDVIKTLRQSFDTKWKVATPLP
jgi:hypothetical protein